MSLLSDLRAAYRQDGFNGFLVPRADRHQNETPPRSDERLAFVTGFTGSAGLAIVLDERAALFVDGRYEEQAARQVDRSQIDVVPIADTPAADWLKSAPLAGGRVAYDPWLHTATEIERLTKGAAAATATLEPAPGNYVDPLWRDRPAPPTAPAYAHPDALAGETAASKRARVAETLAEEKLDAMALTDPTAIAWLLNIRGADTPNTPIVLAYALLDAAGRVRLFTDPERFDSDLRAALGNEVAIEPIDAFETALAEAAGRIGVDKARAPVAVAQALEAAGAEVVWREDPLILPRARKNAAEIAGARAAHLRDGVAMVRFLAWLDGALAAGERLDEAGIGERLVETRRETAAALGARFVDESFAHIVAFGANGALPHYRAPAAGSAVVAGDGLLLIDSGAQYPDGTTDVTRTIAVGAPSLEMRAACARVLKGMIAVSELRFPEKTPGRALDPFARLALWRAGLDYGHGTGHGVGSFLSVHEGPQSVSARGAAPGEAGMIVSNEPGRYKPGAFGVRIENLVLVAPAETPTDALLPGEPAGERKVHRFETLTLAPIDRRILAIELLDASERAWLDAYHARVRAEIGPYLASGPTADAAVASWLDAATAPIGSRGALT